MPNPQNPGTQKPGPHVSKDSGPGAHQLQNAPEQDEDERDESERVEIGDPIPEDQRTVRASGGQDETGEDEDLPQDDGNVEGSRDERH
jgi:hypothetical protein